MIGLNEGISDISAELELNTEDFFGKIEHAIDNVSQDSAVINAEVNSGDSFEKGRSDGKLYAEGFAQGVFGISAEVELNSRHAASTASLNESNLAATAQKIIDAIKNIQIKNTVNTALKVDGRVIAKSVSEKGDILERISDTW